MRAPRPSLVALVLWGLALLLTLGAFALLGAGTSVLVAEQNESVASETIGLLAALAFSTVGAIVASRLPGNPIGWVFCLAGIVLQLENFGGKYAAYTLVDHPGSLPGGGVVAVFADALWIPSIAIGLVYLFLLFPNGRLLSRRWRPVLFVATLCGLLSVPLTVLQPAPLYYAPGVDNPLGIEALVEVADVAYGAIFVPTVAAVLLSLVGLALRMRRSTGTERQQLKWFMYAALLFALAIVPTIVLADSLIASAVFEASAAGIPIAVGVAILKYRLYDIDRIISRSLAYAVLTVILAGVYFGGVLGLQSVLPVADDSPVAVAASTLVMVALFRPLRGRIQAIVDRRFYRRRYDTERTIESFGAHLRREVDLETLTAELLGVTRDTMQPEHASLWLATEAPSGPDRVTRRAGRVGV